MIREIFLLILAEHRQHERKMNVLKVRITREETESNFMFLKFLMVIRITITTLRLTKKSLVRS